MVDKKNVLIPISMATGVILGAALGYWAPQTALAIDFLGKIFAGGLKILLIPVMLIGTVVGISALGDLRKLGRVTGRILTYFLTTTGIAIIIGLVLVTIMQPGAGAIESIPEAGGAGQIGGFESVSRLLSSLIPGDLIQSLAYGKYLGLVLMAIFLGSALGSMGVRGRTAVSFFKGVNEALLKLVGLVLYLAPVGLLSLVASSVAENQGGLAEWSGALGWYLLVVIIGLAIHGGVVLTLILKFFGQRSPLEFFRNMGPALLTGFGTGSSATAYPITYEALVDKCKIDGRAASMALPLGTVINLNGSALATVVAIGFVAQAVGAPLGILSLLALAGVALLLSLGGSGLPTGLLASMPFMLYAAGLSPEQAALGMAVIYAADWFVDRLRAPVNIWGDAVGAALLAESFELKTARRSPSRERSPIRPGRGRDQSRERSSGRREARPDTRRSPRPDSGTGDKERRSSGRTRTAAPVAGSDTKSRGRQKAPSPFDLKSDGAATLEGIESGRVPTSPSQQPRSGDSERKAPSRQGSRGESPGRTQSRTSRAPSRRTDSDSSRASSGRESSPRSGSERSRSTDRRPRRETPAPPPVVESAPVDPKPAETPPPPQARIAADTVARELAQVSAQLKQAEAVRETPPAPPEEPKIESKTPKVEKPAPPVPPAPKPETQADQAELTLQVDDHGEDKVKESTPTEPVQSFGRTKTYKGAALKNAKKETDKETPKTPTPSTPAAKAPVAETPTPTPTVEASPAVVAAPEATPEVAPPAPAAEPVTKDAPPVAEAADESDADGATEEATFGRVKKKRTRR